MSAPNQEFIYLLRVDPNANNNKFYQMKANGDGNFTATYGRVEGGKPANKVYPMSKWHSIYSQKTNPRKGYVDKTELHATVDSSVSDDRGKVVHDDPTVVDIFNALLLASNTQIKQSYNIGAINVVTPKMLDDAQAELAQMADCLTANDWTCFNDALVRLFHVIPRKMRQVSDHIVPVNEPNKKIVALAREIVGDEQDLLDNLKSRVHLATNDDSAELKQDLFSAMGIVVNSISKQDESYLKQKMTNSAHRYVSAVKVHHAKTRNAYYKWADQNSKNEHHYWHGSRNENWISIFTSGLVLNPTNAVITGKMFGHGIYFADKAQKSIGYTSSRGSYWAKGSQRYGYLALYKVNMGRTWTIQRHQHSHTQLRTSSVNANGYDSVFAKGGADLINNEFIVYDQRQCTPSFLVRIS